MPDHDDLSPHATIVGLDPGTETLGLACITFDVRDLEIERTEALTLKGSKCRFNQFMADMHSARFARLNTLGLNILEYLHYHHPIAVVCESPFFNAKRPQAYGALTEATNMIRQAVWSYDQSVELVMIDPPSVKKAVGAKGNAGKPEMLSAVCALQGLKYNGYPPLSLLDEHSIDAIAVAFSKLNEYRL